MDKQVNEILKRVKINITRPRQLVLSVFLQANESVEYTHFINHDQIKLDRTTVFRTLKLFAKKNIIYKVPARDGTSRYLLQEDLAKRDASPGHLSFYCIQCGKATSITDKPTVRITLPTGFVKRNIEIIINGFCKTCNG